MAVISTQKPTAAGVALTYSSITSGDTFVNTGREFVHIKTTSTGCDVKFLSGPTSNNKCSFGIAGTQHDLGPVTLGTTQDRMFGPFDRDRFNDPATNQVTITLTAVTGVTVAVISAA